MDMQIAGAAGPASRLQDRAYFARGDRLVGELARDAPTAHAIQ
jgi:hypothetical protein